MSKKQKGKNENRGKLKFLFLVMMLSIMTSTIFLEPVLAMAKTEGKRPIQVPTKTPTATPTPTKAPTPTPMPAVKGVKELNKIMYVKSTVNVRSGPSTKYDIIGNFATGESVKVIGQSEQTGWYRVIYKGKDAYVSNNYLQDNPVPQSATTQSMSEIENLLNNAPLHPKRSSYEPLNEIIDRLFSEILDDSMTTYQKVKTCYDYLIDNCSYGENTVIYDYIWDLFFYPYEEIKAYGMLTGFIGGCSDYSAAFAAMMQTIGLDCYTVEGDTSAAAGGYLYHIWCEMLLNDVIYVFDPQVEDNIAKGGTVLYYRFGKTYEQVPKKYIKYTYTPEEPEPVEPETPSEEIHYYIEGNFEYKIEDGEAEIVKFTGYDVSEVVIPKEIDGYLVTSIGAGAFKDCSNLCKVELPQGLVSIEEKAFAFCENLVNLEIPFSVVNIGKDAFKDCNNLTIITVKNSYAETYAKENNIKREVKIKIIK